MGTPAISKELHASAVAELLNSKAEDSLLLNQTQLAHVLGVSTMTVSGWEKAGKLKREPGYPGKAAFYKWRTIRRAIRLVIVARMLEPFAAAGESLLPGGPKKTTATGA